MVHLDANIIIYLGNGSLASESLDVDHFSYASIVRIETLGYKGIAAEEEIRISQLFDTGTPIMLTEGIIARAVTIRQTVRMSLGDAIIAATALEADAELWTANTEDFAGIDGLKLINPLVTT